MLTIEKVANLLQDLRSKTESGELNWTPFMKQNKAGKTIVGFRVSLANTDLNNSTVFKLKHIVEDDESLTLKAKVRRRDFEFEEDRVEYYVLRVASITSTPTLKQELLNLKTAVILANRKLPDWAESALFGD